MKANPKYTLLGGYLMKKYLSVFTALEIMLSLTACNGGESSSKPTNSPAQTESSPQTYNTTQTESSPQTSSSVPDEKPVTNNTTKPGEFQKTATLAETVMVDENDVKITATGLNYNNYEVELELLFENNSAKDLSFVSGSMGYCCNSVNGMMVSEGYLNCDVPAGKKAVDTVSFSYNGLMLYGIDEIADIEIGFDISDDDYNHTYTGPRQVKTSVADSYDYGAKSFQTAITGDECRNNFGYTIEHFSAEELYNENSISIESFGLMKNEYGDHALLLEAVNGSSEQVYITTSQISINGLLVQSSDWSSDTINPGKSCIVDVNLSDIMRDSYWDIYGIKDIGEIALDIEINDMDGAAITEAKTITMTLPGKETDFDKSGAEVYSGNGVRVLSKGIVESGSEYSKDMYALFVIENSNADEITIDDVYNSLSVNGFMCDYVFYQTTVDANRYALLEIMLWESSLEKNKITAVSDITEIEVSMDIKDSNGNRLDSPSIKISY